MPIVRKWIVRTEKYWMMDWGSLINPVWKTDSRVNRFRQYTKPRATRPIQPCPVMRPLGHCRGRQFRGKHQTQILLDI